MGGTDRLINGVFPPLGGDLNAALPNFSAPTRSKGPQSAGDAPVANYCGHARTLLSWSGSHG